MDYGKWKYQQQKKLHQTKKKQHAHELKELRIRPKTDQHDLQIKINKARTFLEDGHKVQFTMIFRGRERQHPDIAREIFSDITAQLADISQPEKESRFEGRRMFIVLAPSAKKSSGNSKKSVSTSSKKQVDNALTSDKQTEKNQQTNSKEENTETETGRIERDN